MNRHDLAVFILALALPAAALLAGCTTRSAAQANAREAFLAGQNAALRQQQASQLTGVTIRGPVQNPQEPREAGLTLVQAVATANYLSAQAPKEIIITRQGESAKLDAAVLLNGVQLPLEPGDVIELR